MNVEVGKTNGLETDMAVNEDECGDGERSRKLTLFVFFVIPRNARPIILCMLVLYQCLVSFIYKIGVVCIKRFMKRRHLSI